MIWNSITPSTSGECLQYVATKGHAEIAAQNGILSIWRMVGAIILLIYFYQDHSIKTVAGYTYEESRPERLKYLQ